MKRIQLIRLLERNGWELIRDVGPHSVYANGDRRESIPRHKEINELLAKKIIKRRRLKE